MNLSLFRWTCICVLGFLAGMAVGAAIMGATVDCKLEESIALQECETQSVHYKKFLEVCTNMATIGLSSCKVHLKECHGKHIKCLQDNIHEYLDLNSTIDECRENLNLCENG